MPPSLSEVMTLARQLMNAGTGQAPQPAKPGAVREACPDQLLLLLPPPKMTAAGDGGQLFWGQGVPYVPPQITSLNRHDSPMR